MQEHCLKESVKTRIKPRLKQARMVWDRKCMSYGSKKISNKNMCNLDDPDDWNCYWHDIRK